MNDSVVVCSEGSCSNPKRPRGPECRKCYKRLHKQGRRAQRAFEKRVVSLDSVAFQLERKRYDEWYSGQ